MTEHVTDGLAVGPRGWQLDVDVLRRVTHFVEHAAGKLGPNLFHRLCRRPEEGDLLILRDAADQRQQGKRFAGGQMYGWEEKILAYPVAV